MISNSLMDSAAAAAAVAAPSSAVTSAGQRRSITPSWWESLLGSALRRSDTELTGVTTTTNTSGSSTVHGTPSPDQTFDMLEDEEDEYRMASMTSHQQGGCDDDDDDVDENHVSQNEKSLPQTIDEHFGHGGGPVAVSSDHCTDQRAEDRFSEQEGNFAADELVEELSSILRMNL
jgi:hypothetical protein